MSEISPAGMPVLGRHKLADPLSSDEVLLNLYLDQPAILYGHHVDVADGYEVLAEAAARLSSVEGLTWASLRSIARENIVTRSDGDDLRIRLFSRRATVDVAPGTRALQVEVPYYESHASDRLVHDGRECETATENGVLRATIPLDAATPVELRLVRQGAATGARLGLAPHAVARRATRELRDRMHPLLRRVGLEKALRRLEVVYVDRMTARERARESARRREGPS
jgi:hypothetical protein